MRRLLLLTTLTLLSLLPVLAQEDQDPPTLSDFTAYTDSYGRVVFSLNTLMHAEWVQIWVGDDNMRTQYLKWHNLAEAATCNEGICTLPLPYRPEVGAYVTYVQLWGPGGFSTVNSHGWYGPTNFTVEAPPPQPNGNFLVGVTGLGDLQVILNDTSYTQWVQIWVGDDDLNTVYQKWMEVATSAECDGPTCTFSLNLYPGYGSYQVYVQPWGDVVGFAKNNLSGWFGPQTTSITTPPPNVPTDLRATTTTLSWQHDTNALWYHVWVGTLSPQNDVIYQWYEAAAIGCSSGTCTIPLSGNLPYGTELMWYVRGWGPGGFSDWSKGPDFTIGNTDFALGGQVHYFEHPDRMRDAGLNWVKRQLVFEYGMSLDTARAYIEDAEDEGFHLVLSILGNRDQLAADFDGFTAAYAAWVGQVAALMPADSAIEVWNEPNLEREWPTDMISGQLYTQVLAATYSSIKQNNASIMVISAAPAPTGVSLPGQVTPDNVYLQEMKNAGAEAYMDCVGVHYNEGVLPPTATSGDPRTNPNFHSRYYPAMVNLYSDMFPSKPLCFTELGYLTGEDIGPMPQNFGWAEDTTLAEHASWLAQAAAISRDDPRVRMMIIWNVDFTNWGVDPMVGWAMIRPNGSCPSCTTLKPIFNP